MRSLLRLSLFFVALFGVISAQAQEGIFADFVTSQGHFTCQLYYDKAPRTVANFIGLTTGERSWLNLPTGEVTQRPFYNGLTFHRVVSGFVIQGGSPNGNGTDGPGYTFRDEFDPSLRHSKAGILSMANSGLNSNGSQFFITLAATSFLDDVHSVFGEVTSGMSVVNAIGNTPVDSNSKPLTPVIMQSVAIRRVGSAANAFNVASQGLPTVGGAGPEFLKNGSNSFLRFPWAVYSEFFLYHSGNLKDWTQQRLGLFLAQPAPSDLDVTTTATGQNMHFYRVPRIAYPGPLFTPPALLPGNRIRMPFSANEVLDFNFTTSSTGTITYTLNGNVYPGTISQYIWTQEAYRGRLVCVTDLFGVFVLSYVFNDATTGVFKGTYGNQNPLSGTFIFSN